MKYSRSNMKYSKWDDETLLLLVQDEIDDLHTIFSEIQVRNMNRSMVAPDMIGVTDALLRLEHIAEECGDRTMDEQTNVK